MSAKLKVVVTGACGYIIQRMWPELNQRYEVVGVDVKPMRCDGTQVPDIITCDLTHENRDNYRAHFKGADAIIHSAFVSANTHNFWSIANARQVIGYAPEDDSQVLFADRIAQISKG